MRTKPREDMYGGVIASLVPCTVLDRDAETCGQPGQADLPVGICEWHAIAITRAVLAMGGVVVEER